jgi:hypothetical protein
MVALQCRGAGANKRDPGGDKHMEEHDNRPFDAPIDATVTKPPV